MFLFSKHSTRCMEKNYFCVFMKRKVILMLCHDMIPDAKNLANCIFDTNEKTDKNVEEHCKIVLSSFTTSHCDTKIFKWDSHHKSFINVQQQ